MSFSSLSILYSKQRYGHRSTSLTPITSAMLCYVMLVSPNTIGNSLVVGSKYFCLYFAELIIFSSVLCYQGKLHIYFHISVCVVLCAIWTVADNIRRLHNPTCRRFDSPLVVVTKHRTGPTYRCFRALFMT